MPVLNYQEDIPLVVVEEHLARLRRMKKEPNDKHFFLRRADQEGGSNDVSWLSREIEAGQNEGRITRRRFQHSWESLLLPYCMYASISKA
jgi:hypothetical protein